MKLSQRKDIISMIMTIFIKNVILVVEHVINIVIQKILDAKLVILMEVIIWQRKNRALYVIIKQ